jgi:tetratricopeptide (TPR) repeat protein
MKRTAYWGCSLLFLMVLLVPSPGWAQADVDAYTTFYGENEPAKKLAMGEKFLADFKTSQYAEGVFLTIVPMFSKANNWPKVIEYVSKLEELIPSMKPNNKAVMYSQGMIAAQQSNNAAKTLEFGGKVLAIAPGDVNTLVTMSSTIPRALPTDEAGKTAALNKAKEYAGKALTEVGKLDAKSVGLSEADWAAQRAATEASIHFTLGEIAFNQKDYEKAIEELTMATKAMPKDGPSWYYLGLSYDQQYNAATRNYVDAVTKANAAIKERADKFVIDELKATSDALEEILRAKRDQAIETLAAAVANGIQQARARLETLYKAKNNDSLQGLDQLINSKKTM